MEKQLLKAANLATLAYSAALASGVKSNIEHLAIVLNEREQALENFYLNHEIEPLKFRG